MAEKLRVHLLADDLGVSSAAILAKCRAEGLDIKNHMSTLSAGQAATIREWFSEGSHTTVVETAERVDLKKVRARPRRKKAAKPTEDSPEAAAVADAAIEEAPSEAPPVDDATLAPPAIEEDVTIKRPPTRRKAPAAGELAEAAAIGEGATTVAEPAPPSVTLSPAAILPEVAAPPPSEVEALADSVLPAAIVPEAPPAPPEPVRPAGPQNVPAPAQLQGPKVIRVERPEPIYRPPPRSTVARAPGSPLMAPPPVVPGRRGRGKERVGEEPEEAGKAAKHRVHPRRTGRASDAGERLKEWRDRDLIERQEKIQAASGRGIHAHRAVEGKAVAIARPAVRKTQVEITEPIVMHEFCAVTGIGMQQLAPKLMRDHGILPNRNTVLESELAQLLALDAGIELKVAKAKTALDLLRERFESMERKNMAKRPPVVTFLGHVDHGKTSLLDAIRQTRVAAGEAGGITQHIGAYRLDRNGLSVTFLDTPGHEAFTAMRARGANMTDVVVLVVAADDGVMPQTVEAISHAKAAKVPIVVALNKIDLPNADPNRVLGQLSEHGLIPQKWGGDVDVIETSATRGEGIDELIEHLSTLSDLLDLKSDPTIAATGTVIESKMQEGVGAVARVLVQDGTLREGDILVCGPAFGRVRALRDDLGRRVESAGPGTPVEVAGLDCVPDAGDKFYQVEDLKTASSIAEGVQQQRRESMLTRAQRPRTLEDLFTQRESGEVPILNLILRADVQGSVDVLRKALAEIPSDQVRLNVLHAAVGSISEGDVVLAEASDAMIVGFHVVPDQAVQRLADRCGVQIKLYRVIYNLTDDIRKALEGLLEPDRKEEFRGRADVRQVFNVSRIGRVAGCYVTEGLIKRQNYVRVLRDGRIILPTAADAERGRHRGLTSLKRFKEDASEVRAGFECGVKIEEFDDVQPGDTIEAYEVIEVARKL